MAQSNAMNAPLLAYLAENQPLSPVAIAALRVAVAVDKWSTRRRTRLALSKLEPHQLNDVGLDPRTAFVESRRMFWQG